ncbi:hypothetical protein [Phyllobacterium sp. P30BS-XVII]|uniref:hypothetical protein n=1 Tax=Phyllobacterium sp. P30BS-XVII TaxID=2587046 RepID=UPI0015F7CF80|nr:hypothetical protein [Phyllobacterium sp. P30BS-XVII]MBA8903174.1 hypothetical protein [Phyllobacterium sp. P30BS-XVII]
MRFALSFVMLSLALCGASLAADPELPAFARYQVPFLMASDAKNARATIEDRASSVVNWNACGREIDFFGNAGSTRWDPENEELHGLADGDITPFVIGKLFWIHNNHSVQGEQDPPPCVQTVRYFSINDISHWKKWAHSGEDFRNHTYKAMMDWPDDAGLGEPDPKEAVRRWNEAFASMWGSKCQEALSSVSRENDAFLLTFSVSRACMVDQVNRALKSRVKIGSPGTNGLSCRILGKAGQGDWDMAVIALLRALYIDRKYHLNVIFSDTKQYVFNNLLSISGELEGDSYDVASCGNQDNDQGSAQERVDEEAFYNDGFFGDLGDLLGWLFRWLIVILIIAAFFLSPAGILSALATAAASVVAATVAALVTIWVLQIRVPETENHLLMINSSKYLTNQLMIADLPDSDDRERIEGYQKEIREWLLQRLRRITKEDFQEYNAKPYQRLSIAAILNLYDFDESRNEGNVKLITASRIVLEYATAKSAAGSNQGRRIVPFRRLMETNRFERSGPSDEGMRPRRITDFGSGADHQVAAMLLFSGQLQQLPKQPGTAGAGPTHGLVSIASTEELVWEATSDYRPSEVVLDLAMNKSVTYDQKIHHGGFEIYSSGPGFLITAGGVTTKNALGMFVSPFSLNIVPPLRFKLKNQDRGSGVATTLMVASGSAQLTRNHFIQILGHSHEYSHEDRSDDVSDDTCKTNPDFAGEKKCARNLTNDDNLCVLRGFACGTNVMVPLGIDRDCLKPAAGVDASWEFLDSASCPAYADAPPFYLVVFRKPCPPDIEGCDTKWGFFEAVDRASTAANIPFPEFIQQTVSRNPTLMVALSNTLGGTYKTWRGDTLIYVANGHDTDNDSAGFKGINNLSPRDIDDWPLADGDALTADGKGRATIRSPSRAPAPGRVMAIKIDFTDWENPKFDEVQ